MQPTEARPRRTSGVRAGRSHRVVERVLAAAVAELAESGYAAFRMDAVTAAAGVNKTTVYRRWPSRRALVEAIVGHLETQMRDRPLPDTGALEDDLVAAFSLRGEVAAEVEGLAWARLLAERAHPDLSALVGAVVTRRQAEWRALVDRAIRLGELPPETRPLLLLDLVRALVDDPSLAARGLQDKAWISLAVRTVVAGARAGVLS
jgi:AcrR family transcriptional regulator